MKVQARIIDNPSLLLGEGLLLALQLGGRMRLPVLVDAHPCSLLRLRVGAGPQQLETQKSVKVGP